MNIRSALASVTALTVALLAGVGCGSIDTAQAAAAPPTTRGALRAFANEAELRAYVEPLVASWREQEAARERQRAALEAECRAWEAANPGQRCIDRPRARAGVMAAPQAPAAAAPAAAGSPSATESITNNQVAGVDEGGIVKVHGRHLVVLRRGRLFSIDVGAAALRLDDTAAAYAIHGALPVGGWYDEMLIDGDTIVVIGYSHRRGGTEIGLFDIDAAGRITHRATHILRSADYYSSRNYASRLVGRELILYAPVPLRISADPLLALPSLGPWRGETPTVATPLVPPTRIYRTDEPLDPRVGVSLHTVVRCDLGQQPMACEASGVLGPHGRVFFVSATAVYIWTVQGGWSGVPTQAALFRLPLDRRALPGAIKTEGSPIDALSFAEDADGALSVLLRANGRGDAMWRAEGAGGNLALLQLTRDDFGDGQGRAPARAYRALPPVADGALQNRHVGRWLLYGATQRQNPRGPLNSGAFANRHVVAIDRGRPGDDRPRPAQVLEIGHSVDRIEALGAHALVVGASGSDLHFSPVRLTAAGAVHLDPSWVQAGAAQAESRTHGFFFRQDAQHAQGVDGVAALPVRVPVAPAAGAVVLPGQPQWREPLGSMVWLRVRSGAAGIELAPLGQVTAAGVPPGLADGCVASCVDWYGNARPIFLGQRMLALLGYELVEVEVSDRRAEGSGGASLRERQRLDFMPRR